MAVTQNTYTGNGSTVLYSFTFPYLETTDIKVSVNGTVVTTYTFANATTIQFNTAPANGAAIRIYRQTDDSALPATFYSGSAIRSADLNDNFTQNLYVTQESTNNAATATTTANTALSNSSTALSQSNTAIADSATALSQSNTAISDSATALSQSNTAISNSASAVSTANTAASNASTALSQSNTAISDSATALSQSNTAIADSATAVSDSATALSTANTALSTANTALSTATTADTNATAALNAVAGTVQYVLVANVAAIPGTPGNGDAIEIADSTGIESFTPLTNLPAGFVGDSGLSVRLQYLSSGSSWNWLNYFANNAETRYLKLAGGTLTGQLKADDSTSVAAPVIAFDGDTNTGVAHTGADELALVTGGTSRLTIDSSGAVAIAGALTKGGNNVVTVGDTGTVTSTMLLDGTILNADINASAAIAGTKISPDFGSQNVTTTGNVTVNAQGDLRFGDADSSNWVAFQGPATVSSNVTWTLPSADGTANQVLSTNGSGTLSWATAAASGATVTTSDTAPSTPVDGDLWYDSVGGRLYVYYQDPNGSQWVDAAPQGGGSSTPTKIEVGNTKAEVTDTGSNGTFAVTTEGTQRLTVDSSGRTLIGTTSTLPVYYGAASAWQGQFQVARNDQNAIANFSTWDSSASTYTSYGGVQLHLSACKSGTVGTHTSGALASGDSIGTINFNASDGSNFRNAARIEAVIDAASGTGDVPGRIVLSTTPDGSASPVERMRVTNVGIVNIGTSGSTLAPSTTSSGITLYPNDYSVFSSAGNEPLTLNRNNDGALLSCRRSGTNVGSISVTTTATAFNTSSDYRLKENVVPLTGAANRLRQIPVHRFNFIAEPDKTVDGFLAHEAQEIVPECVIGEKDAVDENGDPIYQGIDQSKLVPLITAALQEALQKIETQGAAIAALEAANTDLAARITALEAN